MRIVPFEPEHLEEMADLGGQDWMLGYLADDHAEALAAGGPGFTGFIDGKVVGMAGITVLTPYRATTWAAVSRWSARHFLTIHRAVWRFVWQECTVARLEAFVDMDYGVGHRWAKMLGFEPEGGPKEFYLADGRAAQEYVRIRHDLRRSSRSDEHRLRGDGGDIGNSAGQRAGSSSSI